MAPASRPPTSTSLQSAPGGSHPSSAATRQPETGRLVPADIVLRTRAAADCPPLSHSQDSDADDLRKIRRRARHDCSLFDPDIPFNNRTVTRYRFVSILRHQYLAATLSARFQVWVCGRRWGKSWLNLQLLAAYLLSGESRRAWWIGPTIGQIQFVWRAARDMLAGRIVSISKTYLRIELDTGSTLEFHSAEQGDSLRGAGLDRVVIDEAALIDESVWTHILRPMLAISRGGAVFAGTPAGQNWFYRAYLRGMDESEPEWAALKSPTSDNPLIADSELDEAKRGLSDAVFRQEFLAEFVSDESNAFPNVRDCVRDISNMPGLSGVLVAGVDWGLIDDYTAIIALDPNTMRVVDAERFRRMGVNATIEKVAAFCTRHQVKLAVSDDTGIGKGLTAGLINSGVPVEPFTFTSLSKTRLMLDLTVAFECREIRLPAIEPLISELESCRRTVNRHGEFKVNAPSGGHDDFVDALALALYGARSGAWRMATVPDAVVETPQTEGVFYL